MSKDYYKILGVDKKASKEDKRKNKIFSEILFENLRGY